MNSEKTLGIKEKSAEHLINLRAVYQKNPELIDEFVRALEFNCQQGAEVGCDGCIFKYPDFCCMTCDSGIGKLNSLMELVKAGEN